MNQNAHFETVFSTFPLFYIGVLTAAVSYITFVIMMRFIKRCRLLKEVLDGKYDNTDKDQEEDDVFMKEPFLSFMKNDRKYSLIQAAIFSAFFLSFIGIFVYYLIEVGSAKDFNMFVFTFSLMAAVHNFINSINKIVDAKRTNYELQQKIRPEMYSQFKGILKKEAIYLYASLVFDVFCIAVVGWFLYKEFV